MTDTAIPIPDDAQARMAAQAQAALDAFTRAFAPVIREVERGVAAAGRVLGEHMEASVARWRVRRMMPTLTMRGVLVHGYVPTGEA